MYKPVNFNKCVCSCVISMVRPGSSVVPQRLPCCPSLARQPPLCAQCPELSMHSGPCGMLTFQSGFFHLAQCTWDSLIHQVARARDASFCTDKYYSIVRIYWLSVPHLDIGLFPSSAVTNEAAVNVCVEVYVNMVVCK